MAFRSCPVFSFFTVTEADGMTAREASVTVPVMRAESVCENTRGTVMAPRSAKRRTLFSIPLHVSGATLQTDKRQMKKRRAGFWESPAAGKIELDDNVGRHRVAVELRGLEFPTARGLNSRVAQQRDQARLRHRL